MNRKLFCFLLALCVAALATAKDAASDCGDMIKAVPDKIGDLPIAKKECHVITSELAKVLHATPGARYLNADYEQESSQRYIRIKVVNGDSAMPSAKDNAALIANEKDREKILQRTAATGNPDWIKAYHDDMAHSRIVPLSQPEEAVLVWHDGPDFNAEVNGVVYGTSFVTIYMSASDIDAASSTLSQVNSAMKYALLR